MTEICKCDDERIRKHLGFCIAARPEADLLAQDERQPKWLCHVSRLRLQLCKVPSNGPSRKFDEKADEWRETLERSARLFLLVSMGHGSDGT